MRLDHVLGYATNDNKTKNPSYNSDDLQALRDVMNYATHDFKTEKQHYISGINCNPKTAREEMAITKKRFCKEGGIVAFHGYQSFAEGEVTPELCHAIGVKLAEQLWGDRFEVVVATHLDKKHLHNHFVLNSVSFKDGLRYYDSNTTYDKMRITSDKLCRENHLSVILNPQKGRRPSYAAYLAQEEKKPTLRSIILKDIDTAISLSMTMQQFFINLEKMGYQRKRPNGKYFTLCPLGKDGNIRIDRNNSLYSLENIKNRILAQSRPTMKPFIKKEHKVFHLNKPFNRLKKRGGLRGLYFHYCYKLGIFSKDKSTHRNFLFREDMLKIETISKEVRLLRANHIDTFEQLTCLKNNRVEQMRALCENRKHLRYRLRSIKDTEQQTVVKSDITALTNKIADLRQDVKLCEGIYTRSAEMRNKINKVYQAENKGKERFDNEYKRRSGRPNR